MTEPAIPGQVQRAYNQPQTERSSGHASEQIMLRMSPGLLTRIDAYMASLQIRNPGITVSRADAIRNLVELGLEVCMVDRREDIRRLIGSLAYLFNVDSEMASEHGAPMYAGISPSDVGILNGYLKRAKELCPANEAIQELRPVDSDGWYGQYRTLMRALLDFLGAELEAPQIAVQP